MVLPNRNYLLLNLVHRCSYQYFLSQSVTLSVILYNQSFWLCNVWPFSSVCWILCEKNQSVSIPQQQKLIFQKTRFLKKAKEYAVNVVTKQQRWGNQFEQTHLHRSVCLLCLVTFASNSNKKSFQPQTKFLSMSITFIPISEVIYKILIKLITWEFLNFIFLACRDISRSLLLLLKISSYFSSLTFQCLSFAVAHTISR